MCRRNKDSSELGDISMLEMKRSQQYTITIPVKVSGETLFNILWGAIHQGSKYWLGGIVDSKGQDAHIGDILKDGEVSYVLAPEDDNDESYRKYPITLQDVIKGLERYCRKYGDCIEDGNIDSCSIDSPSCDLILQYAIFGEQVFG